MNEMLRLRTTLALTQLAGRVATRPAGRLAAKLWFTPWRVPDSERVRQREAEWLRGTDPLEVHTDRRRLRGFGAGEGPVVLLVHGWADRASRMGGFVRPLVEGGYRVVAIDLPAHGDSGDGETDALEIAAAVRTIAAAVGPIHAVVAHSMGAHATTLALTRGLEVDGAVLLAPSVRLEHALGPFAALFRLPPKAVRGLRRDIERRFGEDIWTEMAGDALARNLVGVPALIVHDPEDPQVPYADSELLASAWRGARLMPVEGAGHTKILRDERVVGAALEFLRELPVRVGADTGRVVGAGA